MSKDGFTALVRIVRASISAGYGEYREDDTRSINDLAYMAAEMDLEGNLIELNYSELKGRVGKNKTASLRIEIEFSNRQQTHYRTTTEHKPYIGLIHLNDWRSEEEGIAQLHGIVRIHLPLNMFDRLASMKQADIIFDSVHDVIVNPTNDQKTDHIIAFVKRVYFETKAVEEPPPRKGSSAK